MRALIDHVERGAVGVSRRSRRCFAVPVVDEALRGSDAFENGVRRSDDMAADDECSLAAVRVGDANYIQAPPAVREVPDIVMRQWGRAWGVLEAHELSHPLRA